VRRVLALGAALSTLSLASTALAYVPTVTATSSSPYVLNVHVRGGGSVAGSDLVQYRLNYRFSDGSQFEQDVDGVSSLSGADFQIGARSTDDLAVSFQAQRVATVGPFDVRGDWSNWVTFTASSRNDGTIRSAWGTCIDVPLGNTTPGTLLQNWECIARDRDQQWIYDDKQFGHFIDWSGNVMDVFGYSTANGARVDTFYRNQQLNQIFYLTSSQILGMGDKCLDDFGGAPGTLVRLFDCHGSPNQLWSYMNGQISVAGGTTCLEADVSNRIDVRMNACTGSGQQTWLIEPGGRIENLATGRCLNLPNWDFDNSAPVQQGDCVATSTGEKWAWRGNITTPINGACLDLQDGNSANGTPIQMWQCIADDPNQEWYFAP
jgi:hypothetical protein